MLGLPRFFRRLAAPRVLVFADFIDPFCYIGFHALREAARETGARLEWRGFELNPATPPEGMALGTAGNSDLRPGMWASVADFAKRSGLSISEPAYVPNTGPAQRLAAGLGSREVKIPLIERIYQAYFSDLRDIGDVRVLIELAGVFGIQAREVEWILAASRPARQLARNREEAMRWKFPGMPGFVYGGRTRFGALAQDDWKRVLGPTKAKESSCSTK